MTVHLVTFSDANMSRSASLCVDSALRHGVDQHWFYAPEIIRDWPAVKDHPLVFRQPENPNRAYAWFAWKPLVVNEVLGHLKDGDYLIYSDAGVEFIDNQRYIIDRMDQDIFLFANQWQHAHWCKADIIAEVWPGSTWANYDKQCQASVIFFRVSDYSREFVKEWLYWCLYRVRFTEGVCTDEWRYLIDDSPSRISNHEEFRENRWDQAILSTLASRQGVALHWWPASYGNGSSVYPRNHPEFKENRHDQAILTTMARREGIEQHRWPARYNSGTSAQFDYHDGNYADDYPVLYNHHRKRDHEWSEAA